MAKKSEILNNLQRYSLEQIADAVRTGIVSMYELSKTGQMTPLMRRRIEGILSSTSVEHQLTKQPPVEQITIFPRDIPSTDIAVGESNELQNQDKDDIPEIIIPQEPMVSSGQLEIDMQNSNTTSNKGLFQHPFSFKGRIRRLEYGISYIIYIVYAFIASLIASLTIEALEEGFVIILYALLIPAIWFMLAQGAKRCHDRGNSGWWQLIPFYWLWMLFAEGDKCSNEYGNNPK